MRFAFWLLTIIQYFVSDYPRCLGLTKDGRSAEKPLTDEMQ